MIGSLRERVILQKRIINPDGMGGGEDSYSDYALRWAKIEPVSANQKFQAMQLSLRVTHKIIIRYEELTDLKSDFRIIYNSRIFEIQTYRNIMEKDKFIEIMASEGDPA